MARSSGEWIRASAASASPKRRSATYASARHCAANSCRRAWPCSAAKCRYGRARSGSPKCSYSEPRKVGGGGRAELPGLLPPGEQLPHRLPQHPARPGALTQPQGGFLRGQLVRGDPLQPGQRLRGLPPGDAHGRQGGLGREVTALEGLVQVEFGFGEAAVVVEADAHPAGVGGRRRGRGRGEGQPERGVAAFDRRLEGIHGSIRASAWSGRRGNPLGLQRSVTSTSSLLYSPSTLASAVCSQAWARYGPWGSRRPSLATPDQGRRNA